MFNRAVADEPKPPPLFRRGRIGTINAELTRQSRSPGKKALNVYALCCVLLFCFVLSRVVLCRVDSCCAVLSCAVQSCVVLSCVEVHCVALHLVCCAELCCAVLCCDALRLVLCCVCVELSCFEIFELCWSSV